MILSYVELLDLIDVGVIEGADPACVNSASIDIHLGDTVLIERPVREWSIPPTVQLDKKGTLAFTEYKMDSNGVTLLPGQFILAQSREVFNLPNNISAEYKLKSSMARIGLEHLNAGWCDAGWHGSVLTLELKNVTEFHAITIRPGDRIGQMVFFSHTPVPDHGSYATRGSYNGDKKVSGVKVAVRDTSEDWK